MDYVVCRYYKSAKEDYYVAGAAYATHDPHAVEKIIKSISHILAFLKLHQRENWLNINVYTAICCHIKVRYIILKFANFLLDVTLILQISYTYTLWLPKQCNCRGL